MALCACLGAFRALSSVIPGLVVQWLPASDRSAPNLPRVECAGCGAAYVIHRGAAELVEWADGTFTAGTAA